jgi:hypothetical protein
MDGNKTQYTSLSTPGQKSSAGKRLVCNNAPNNNNKKIGRIDKEIVNTLAPPNKSDMKIR